MNPTVIVFLLAAIITGCSTVAGVGNDITSMSVWTKEKMGGSK